MLDELSGLKKRIWSKKYGGDPTEVFQSIVSKVFGVLSKEEKKEIERRLDVVLDDLYDIMISGKGLPGGRVIAYFGSPSRKTTPMNCYVTPIHEDSIEGIFKYCGEIARVFSWGGGSGGDISGLRPNGSRVNNASNTSTGAVSFLSIINETIGRIGQNGRRGAGIETISVYHPDIKEFIQAKLNGSLGNMNISVKVDQNFMENDEITLWYPHEIEAEDVREYSYVDYPSQCYDVEGEFFYVRSEDVYRMRVEYDIVKTEDIKKLIYECAWKTGDPGVIFWDHMKEDTILNLYSTNPCFTADTMLLDGDKLTPIANSGSTFTSWCKGEENIVELQLSNNAIVRMTKDHKIMLKNESFCKAENCLGKELYHPFYMRPDHKFLEHSRDQMLRGFLFGDGFLVGQKYGVSVKLSNRKEGLASILLSHYLFNQEKSGTFYVNRSVLEEQIGDVSFLEDKVFDRDLPDDIYFGKAGKVFSFLRGLWEANGSAKTNGQLSLKATCESMIRKVQTILMSNGIHCSLSYNASKVISWNNGDYESKVSWNLQIPKTSAWLFKELIGFISEYKTAKVSEEKKSPAKLTVKDIRSAGVEEVWDYRMNKKPHHNFCGGLVAKNCGEEPLLAYLACNLFAINISELIVDKEYENICKIATVFLDCLTTYSVQNNLYPLDVQKEKGEKYRPIGVGLTGVADSYISNGRMYGEEGFLEKYAQKKKEVCEHTSEVLGEILGNCEGFGRRNCQLGTVAPTGSISMLLGCSSGIEPHFSLDIEKKFGDNFEELELEILRKNPERKLLVTAHDIDVETRLRVQHEAQKWTDGSISSTINLEETATIEDVRRVYERAYEYGLKGVTVFRDGCKDGALRKKSPKKSHRGILDGKTVKIPSETSWYVTVNFDEDRPVEVFINASKSGTDTKAWTEAAGRLISLYLQSGGEVEKVITSLQDIKGQETIFRDGWIIQSGPDAISKAIGKILEHREEGEVCPECEKKKYIRVEGCGICRNCGHSSCT